MYARHEGRGLARRDSHSLSETLSRWKTRNMIDTLHVVLFALLLVQGIGWLLIMKCLWTLLEDLSSTEMRIANLVRSVKENHGLPGTDA
jgi:hypothetical protein